MDTSVAEVDPEKEDGGVKWGNNTSLNHVMETRSKQLRSQITLGRGNYVEDI